MRSKDWEYHAALLHKHDSAKFNHPTKRMRCSPAIETFEDDGFDLVILVACGAVFAIVMLLLAFKVMS